MGKGASGALFCMVLSYIQGYEVTLRCRVGRGSLDKSFERVLVDIHFWPSGCGCAFLKILTHDIFQPGDPEKI